VGVIHLGPAADCWPVISVI